MKRLSFFLAFVLLFAAGNAFGQCAVVVDNVSAEYDDGGTPSLVPGNCNVDFRMQSDLGCADSPAYNVNNGFKLYFPDGATATNINSGFLPAWDGMSWTSQFNNFFIGPDPITADPSTFSPTPAPVDAGGNAVAASFSGVSFTPANGFPSPFDDVTYTMQFTTNIADAGLSICLDSSFTPPGGTWKWASLAGGGDVFAAWAGPFCWVINQPPNFPPEFDAYNPNETFDHCGVASIQFTATDTESDPFTFAMVSGPGAVDANTGLWTWNTLPQSGFFTIVLSVCDGFGCGTNASVNIEVTNAGPTITCPATATTISVGATKTQTVVTTDDCDVVAVTVLDYGDAAPANVSVVGNDVTYTAEGIGRTVTMLILASDGEKADTCSMLWDVIETSSYQVEIAKLHDVYQGTFVNMPVNLLSVLPEEGIGGFDILVSYDQSALMAQQAVEGQIYDDCGWEYFTYRFGPFGNCGNQCPSGMMRVTGLAETNNGPFHPTCDVAGLPVSLFEIVFLVSNDRTLECQYVPVRFYWYDCGDNSISNVDGDILYVSSRVFDYSNSVPVNDATHGFPTFLGAQEECFVQDGDKPLPEADIDFYNGGIDIVCADSIDARGDINLNGVAYEIADAVMFTNYFIYGLGAFEYVEGSIAASDVNADGIPLSVADLVYLIRVVIGDALPYDKAIPVQGKLVHSGNLNVDVNIAAAHIVIEGTADVTNLSALNMEFGQVDGNTHVLLADLTGQVTEVSGNLIHTNGEILSVEMANWNGQPVMAKIVPGSFALHQNYPNPFNPTTTMAFDLPVASDWTINIYNVTGQLVETLSGHADAGNITAEWDASNLASGIYFYKLSAEDFSATKKAVLLK